MELKPGYKQTEVGVIPEDWGVSRVHELIKHGPKNGYSGRTGKEGQGTPTLSLSATSTGHLVLDSQTIKYLEQRFPKDSDLFLKPGDVLVQRSNTVDLVGTTAIFTGPSMTFVYPDLMMRLRFREPVTAKWFWSYANSIGGRSYFSRVAAGSTGSMPKISGTKLRFMPLPAPPIAEQQAIAEALSDADSLIESLEQLIAKKRDIKQGAMQELLNGKEHLQGFDEDWGSNTFTELFHFSGGYSASRDQLSHEGYCYLHYGDIHKSPKNFIDVRAEYEEIPKLDIALKKIPPTSLLDDGDVVFVDASEDDDGVSKYIVVVNEDKIPYISGLHTIVAKSKTGVLDRQYLRYCFQTPEIKRQFIFYAVGTKVSGISKANIAKLVLRIPPLPEQTAIAEILSEMDAEIAALEAKLAKARAIKEGMMGELLTGRTRLV